MTSFLKNPSALLGSTKPGIPSGISPLESGGSGPAPRPTGSSGATSGEGVTGFVKTLGDTLREANALQNQAAQSGEALARGEEINLHQVMVETQEASLAFQLTLAVRNKALEAYQEILRMQV